MRRILSIRKPPDRYEILLDGALIMRIVKYCGESEYRREIDFDDLSEEIQERIIDSINYHAN